MATDGPLNTGVKGWRKKKRIAYAKLFALHANAITNPANFSVKAFVVFNVLKLNQK